MARRIIPTSELTPDNVPSPDDPAACRDFALTFDGYGYAGGGVDALYSWIDRLPTRSARGCVPGSTRAKGALRRRGRSSVMTEAFGIDYERISWADWHQPVFVR
jgi:hypothetical protein